MNNDETKNGDANVRLLKTEDVCRVLGGISARTLVRLENRGLIRRIPLIRHKLYSMADVESLVEQLRTWKP